MRGVAWLAGVAAAGALGGSAAQAAVVYSLAGPTALMESPGSFDATFDTGGGVATATFRVNGFDSIDGDGNCCTDVFTLSLNGVAVFSGSFDLGGGGANAVFFGPTGSSATVTLDGPFVGGFADLVVPLDLAAGSNTLRFAYSGAPQGIDDEAWSLEGVTVDSAAGVPEPGTWALMIAGLFGAGGAIRARRARTA